MFLSIIANGVVLPYFLGCSIPISIQTGAILSISYYETAKYYKLYSGAPAAQGPPSGAPYPYRKLEETHELIFWWLSWLAVLLVGAYA